MDKKQFITFLTLSATVVALWLLLQAWYDKTHPPQSQPQQISTTNPAPPATAPATTAATTTQPEHTAEAPAKAAAKLDVAKPANANSGDVTIGSAASHDPNYPMQIRFGPKGTNGKPQGDGVADVVLNEFLGPRKSRKEAQYNYTFETPVKSDPQLAALATQSVTIDNEVLVLADRDWSVDARSANSATFSIVIVRDVSTALPQGVPVAKITKTYTLQSRPETKATSEGYEVKVTQTIENLAKDRTIKVKTTLNGPTPPPSESEQEIDHFTLAGYKNSDTSIAIAQYLSTEFKPEAARMDLTQRDSKPYAWVGQASAYFAAFVRPETENSGLTAAAETKDPYGALDRKIALTLNTPEVAIATGQKAATVPLLVYFGPKWRDVLNNNYYAAYPRMYGLTVSVQSKICFFPENLTWCCSWPLLIKGLVWVLIGFHAVLRDWGLSIILLVCVVRIFLHPITKSSQKKMMAMSKLGPAIEKLKEKYAERPDELNKEMMKLHKEQIGAMLGCLPMFLQMPIWIALYTALQGTFELRQAPFLWGWTWIKDLAKPDALIQFDQPLNLILFHMSAINILPILMAIVTFVNQKYFSPKPIPVAVTATNPEKRRKQEDQKRQQETQQMINGFMPLIFPLVMYTMPSGLNLYYLTSTTLQIIESKLIRDHIKKQEEMEKLLGPELVAVKPTRASRRGEKAEPVKAGKPTRMERFLAWMQQMQAQAEQMKKEGKKGPGRK